MQGRKLEGEGTKSVLLLLTPRIPLVVFQGGESDQASREGGADFHGGNSLPQLACLLSHNLT